VKFIPAGLIKQVWLFFVVLSCLALTGTMAAQNQYYVNSNSGSDSNDGSQARPWRTIQHADSVLTVGANGTIVNVAAGNYSGPITTNATGTATRRVVFRGAANYGSKITTANWQVRGSYTDVDGFDMTSPPAGGFCGATFGVDSGRAASFVHFVNNYCHDVSVTGSCTPFGAFATNSTQSPAVQSTDNQVTGNIIRHGGTTNCNGFHGIYADGPRDVIQNNIISGISGWGIQRIANGPGSPFVGVISNNTIFNNGGGILLTEQNNAGFQATIDYTTISNNIIVNNGISGTGTPAWGMNYFHVSGTHNDAHNNMVYGNQPGDYAHHGNSCAGGTSISGSDANGTSGGCPNANPKTDASTSVTFTNFQSDTNSSPASNYDATNYQLKPGSSAIQNGSTSCASSPGLSPCVPQLDIVGIVRSLVSASGLDIGAFEQGTASSSAPAAPTGLTAAVQ
jgi:hypothetical protein